jgi:4-hydroxy-3-methylbut-2-enyl diphosphate reductase
MQTTMTIRRASHLGWCFGVRDAVGDARAAASQGPVTILGDLVHNPAVVESLRKEGVLTRHDPADIATRRVLITAHGASRARLRQLEGMGLEVQETTCPLVHKAHAALDALVRQGFHPVIVGQRTHVEVRGMAEDHPGCDIVLTAEDVDGVERRPRFGVVSQTTQPLGLVLGLVDRLRARFPGSEVVFRDTVCQPTKDRQAAAEQMARDSTVVVVVGGRHSHNTRRLVETCRGWCARVHHVEHALELEAGWFRAGDRVGLTAGTSTPDEEIEGVEGRLRAMAMGMEVGDVQGVGVTGLGDRA